jgi:hypothetical protein
MDDNLQQIIDKANANPDYRALVDYLSTRKQMPSMAVEDLAGGLGMYRPQTNHVVLDRTRGMTPENLLHETTHSAYKNMSDQYLELHKKPNKTPYESQFVDSYEKMNGEGNREMTSPQWYDQQRDYRVKPTEEYAHGVQNANYPPGPIPYEATNVGWRAPGGHLDPTKASEIMMLMEQAKRAQSPPGFLQRLFSR